MAAPHTPDASHHVVDSSNPASVARSVLLPAAAEDNMADVVVDDVCGHQMLHHGAGFRSVRAASSATATNSSTSTTTTTTATTLMSNLLSEGDSGIHARSSLSPDARSDKNDNDDGDDNDDEDKEFGNDHQNNNEGGEAPHVEEQMSDLNNTNDVADSPEMYVENVVEDLVVHAEPANHANDDLSAERVGGNDDYGDDDRGDVDNNGNNDHNEHNYEAVAQHQDNNFEVEREQQTKTSMYSASDEKNSSTAKRKHEETKHNNGNAFSKSTSVSIKSNAPTRKQHSDNSGIVSSRKHINHENKDIVVVGRKKNAKKDNTAATATAASSPSAATTPKTRVDRRASNSTGKAHKFSPVVRSSSKTPSKSQTVRSAAC